MGNTVPISCADGKLVLDLCAVSCSISLKICTGSSYKQGQALCAQRLSQTKARKRKRSPAEKGSPLLRTEFRELYRRGL